MPRNISRRELVQAAGVAAIGMVAATGWTGTAKAAPPPERAPAAAAGTDTAAAEATTLFPWIGI